MMSLGAGQFICGYSLGMAVIHTSVAIITASTSQLDPFLAGWCFNRPLPDCERIGPASVLIDGQPMSSDVLSM